MKSLVIVESPAKAKTINKYLGNNYQVLASMGHVRDLPAKSLGVDVKKNFKPTYEVILSRKKTMAQLKAAAASADKIFLAPDPDREGEAIAWHLVQELGAGKGEKGEKKIYRLTFHEITKQAISESIKNPTSISQEKVDAQQARRILDRLVGYQISPILGRKIKNGLSAGRVQSVAVLLIVNREREILAFVSEEYWSIMANLKKHNTQAQITAKLEKIDDKKTNITNKERADEILADLKDKAFIISAIAKRQKKQNPAPPFTTSKLQQEASRKLKFTAKKTMSVAQQLYEGLDIGEDSPVGLITYMRTDSVRVASVAQEEAAAYIKKKYGKGYTPEKPPVYKSKASAQEAHESIRPTSVGYEPESMKQYLTQDQYRLYKLIWNRFVASQMTSALLEITTADILIQGKAKYLFRITGSVVKFNGFMAVYVESKDEENDEEEKEANEKVLPPLNEGERLDLLGLEGKQHFTQPPPRYTEATLVKALEEKGIGRPSTYAPTISTIQDRKYVEKQDGSFRPTEIGILVTDVLIAAFPDIINIDFTAKMENELDRIEEGSISWTTVLNDFYQPFSEALKNAGDKISDVKKQQEISTDVKCEKCGSQMVVKLGRHGKFLGCPNYPECKYTTPFEVDDQGNINAAKVAVVDAVCDKCGAPMVLKAGRTGQFMACSAYPKCKNAKPLNKDTGEVKEVKAELTDEKCPKCSQPLMLRGGKHGDFLSCSKYPECKYTKSVGIGITCMVINENGQECGGNIVRKPSRKGFFYGCDKYPACKFATWDEPTNNKCPNCQQMLVRKVKKGEEVMLCVNKGCAYNEGR
ncbi:MAG: type I DNA topoisomerase [bacterium]|nr:type I DNA topoisomerase [bacterium]